MNLELSPEPEQIVQAEDDSYEIPVVPVKVCGPIQTRELPAVRGSYQTVSAVGTDVGVRLLSFEPRRKNAVIMATDQDIWLSTTQSGAQVGASGSARVTANVPHVVEHIEELWACSVTSTTAISVITHFWSE